VVYGETLAGEEIRKMFTRAPGGIHLCGATLVDLHGDTATARTRCCSSTHQPMSSDRPCMTTSWSSLTVVGVSVADVANS